MHLSKSDDEFSRPGCVSLEVVPSYSVLVGVFSGGKSTTIYSVFFHLVHPFPHTPSSLITHHLTAASHSFTASPTPRAEILARLLSDQHITFTSAATHKPETSPTHDQLQPFTTTRPVATKVASNNTCAVLALSPNTVQLGQKEIRVQEAHGSHKDETGIVNGQKCYWLVLTVFPPRLSQRR